MDILDLDTRIRPTEPLELKEPWRVIRRNRHAPAGGNLYSNQAMLWTMLTLSEIIGDARFAQFAWRWTGEPAFHDQALTYLKA